MWERGVQRTVCENQRGSSGRTLRTWHTLHLPGVSPCIHLVGIVKAGTGFLIQGSEKSGNGCLHAHSNRLEKEGEYRLPESSLPLPAAPACSAEIRGVKPRPENPNPAVTCVCGAGLAGRDRPNSPLQSVWVEPSHYGLSMVLNAQGQLSDSHNFMCSRKSQAKNTILGSYF